MALLGLMLLSVAAGLDAQKIQPAPKTIVEEGWIMSLRDEKLQIPVHAEITIREQSLDAVILLLARTLDHSGPLSILLPHGNQFPLVSGRLAGHPVTLIENLLDAHGLVPSETGGFLTVASREPDTLSTATYLLSCSRLSEESFPTLDGILEKIRKFLQIPNNADHRITEDGIILGWWESPKLQSRRIKYNPDDNTFFLTGLPRDHAWLKTIVTFLNRPKTLLVLEFPGTGQLFETKTRRMIRIGDETRALLTHTPEIWKSSPGHPGLLPSEIVRRNILPHGSLLRLWIEEPSPWNYIVHVQYRRDLIAAGTLRRAYSHQTIPVPARAPAMMPDGSLLIIHPSDGKPDHQIPEKSLP
ncbi:hypothetical protein AW736_01695 [Termitidicoccus mucosus]|uniref:Uncharacterized protein n=2 Tax=Termitidicoccus mucosus TaxID=1184151 RepID=A0A178IQ00_9BACT|nr:hypothetical protein AW736_01695 [Opitutaceae bacterium TSB47]